MWDFEALWALVQDPYTFLHSACLWHLVWYYLIINVLIARSQRIVILRKEVNFFFPPLSLSLSLLLNSEKGHKNTHNIAKNVHR